MKFLLLHYFDESDLDFDTLPEATAAEDPDPEPTELDAWVDAMESTGVKLHGGRLRPAAEALSG
jgi:hypothetical protein